jgi:hypothetical protein
MRRTVLGEAARQAQTLADVIHYSLEVSAPGTDELTMRRLVEKTGVLENVALVAVLDTDGRIRAASRSGAAVHLDLVREAMQRNAVRSREFSGRYALASPLHGRQFSAAHSDVSGVVYLELDMQPLLDELGGLYGSVLAVVPLLVGGWTNRFAVTHIHVSIAGQRLTHDRAADAVAWTIARTPG